MDREVIYRPIEIRREVDLEKIVAFLRVNARHVDFLVDPALGARLIERLSRFAQDYRSIVLEVVAEDGDLVVVGAVTGAAAGAAVGFVVAGGVGVLLGGCVGGAAGAFAGGLRVRVDLRRTGDYLRVAIA